MNKIKLYHFSNNNIKDKIKVSYYGNNSFTFNDLKVTNIKRSFWYLTSEPLEHRFKHCNYCYIIELNKSRLYDLTIDKKKFLKQRWTIHQLLRYIKYLGYKGIIYDLGYKVVNLFYDTKFTEKIDLTK